MFYHYVDQMPMNYGQTGELFNSGLKALPHWYIRILLRELSESMRRKKPTYPGFTATAGALRCGG